MISSVHLPAEPSAASLALQHPRLLWEIEPGFPHVHSREHQNALLWAGFQDPFSEQTFKLFFGGDRFSILGVCEDPAVDPHLLGSAHVMVGEHHALLSKDILGLWRQSRAGLSWWGGVGEGSRGQFACRGAAFCSGCNHLGATLQRLWAPAHRSSPVQFPRKGIILGGWLLSSVSDVGWASKAKKNKNIKISTH